MVSYMLLLMDNSRGMFFLAKLRAVVRTSCKMMRHLCSSTFQCRLHQIHTLPKGDNRGRCSKFERGEKPLVNRTLKRSIDSQCKKAQSCHPVDKICEDDCSFCGYGNCICDRVDICCPSFQCNKDSDCIKGLHCISSWGSSKYCKPLSENGSTIQLAFLHHWVA
jgi:hypothetical protein